MSTLKVTLPDDLKKKAWRAAHARADSGKANVSAIVIEALRAWFNPMRPLERGERCRGCGKVSR